MGKRLVSISVGAEMLDLTVKGFRAMVERGDIESCKIGRLRKIPLAAIDAFIAQHTTPARS